MSPHIRINDNDEDRPICQKMIPFEVKAPKHFERFSQTVEVHNRVVESESSSESSFDDYTQSKKLAKTSRNSNSSSKKKIETLTLCESPPKPGSKYRNSKIISFGKKQNTTHQNFEDFNNRDQLVIREEGEEHNLDKKDEEEDINPKINSLFSKKNLLDPLGVSLRSPKKSKVLENPLQICTDSSQNPNGSPTNNNNGNINNFGSDSKFHSKLYKVISQFYIVKRFMSSLINATIYRKPKKLRIFHYNLINDWSVFQNDKNFVEEEENRSFLVGRCWDSFAKKLIAYKKKFQTVSKCLKVLRKIFNFVLHPNHPFKMIWDVIHLILIVLFLVIIPLNLSFKVNILDYYSYQSPQVYLGIKVFAFCFFIVDILINFNTAFYDKGELILNRKKINSHYLKGQFFIDIISIFYLYDKILRITNSDPLIPQGHPLDFIGLFFLIRVSHLDKIISHLEEFFFVEEKFYNTFALLRLICFIFFVSHLFACGWHYVAYLRNDDEITWLQYYKVSDEIWWMRYIYSFYYVVIVMNTVGFGDIVPQTYTERVYSIFFIYVACGIFAYGINCIGLVLQDINKRNHNLKKTILLINAYMKAKNINVDLRIRIRKYIEYIWEEEKDQNESETENIINKLSRNLKEELLLNANGIVLREFPVFYMNFSEDSLRKLVYHIKEINLTPGDVIYNFNEVEEEICIYIVRKGSVELFVDTPRNSGQPFTVLRTLKENELFGEYTFFTEMPRETSARSSGFTTLFLIKKNDFMTIIKGNSDDHEIYCQMKDRINLYQEIEGLYQTCPACQKNDHSIINCSMMHLILSKHRILQRFNHSRPQTRQAQQRKPTKTSNALKNFERHENLAQKFSHDQNSDDSDDDSSDVSASNIKMEIKEEFNHLDTDVTNDPTIINLGGNDEKKDSTTSPKFQENKLQKSILRLPSKIGGDVGESFLGNSNKNIDNTLINVTTPKDNNASSINIRKPRSSIRRKPGTTVATSLNRQTSKDSMSKNSIYSKKSSKSNKSIKFFPYEVSLTQNTNEDLRELKKLALLKDKRNPNRQLSNITSTRNKTDDDFSEYMHLLKREKGKSPQANNISEHSLRSRSHRSKESKRSSNKSKDHQPFQIETMVPNEKPMTTLIDIDKNTYDDISKSYEFYFPHNNVQNVLERMKLDSAKKKKKKLGRNNTKNNETYQSLDLFVSPQATSVARFRRRGVEKIEIFKKTNFFKRRLSGKKVSFDKKKFKKMLIQKEREKDSIWVRIKSSVVNLLKSAFNGLSWIKEKWPRGKKKETVVKIVSAREEKK